MNAAAMISLNMRLFTLTAVFCSGLRSCPWLQINLPWEWSALVRMSSSEHRVGDWNTAPKRGIVPYSILLSLCGGSYSGLSMCIVRKCVRVMGCLHVAETEELPLIILA